MSQADIPSLFSFWDKQNIQNIQMRIDYSHLLAAAISHTPRVQPFAEGQTIFQHALVALVPRFLWRDKPLETGGSEYVSRYTGIPFQQVSVGTNYLFEFYINFGKLGGIIGLGIMGLLCGLLDYGYFARAERSLAWEWGIILVIWVLCQTDRVALLFMGLPVALFVAWLMARICDITGWASTTVRPPAAPGEKAMAPSP
jgi:hypothetical protein